MAAAAPKVSACIRVMLMPSVLAVAGSAADARSAVPNRVRVRTSWTAPMTTTASPKATTLTIWTVIPATVRPLLAPGGGQRQGAGAEAEGEQPLPDEQQAEGRDERGLQRVAEQSLQQQPLGEGGDDEHHRPHHQEGQQRIDRHDPGDHEWRGTRRRARGSPCARLTTRMIPKTRDRPRATRA